MVESGIKKLNRFTARYKENADMNQYWYSIPTIEMMVREVEEQCGGSEAGAADAKKAAFLSTPSIYYCLKDKAVKANSKVFDVSQQQEAQLPALNSPFSCNSSTEPLTRTQTMYSTTSTSLKTFQKSYTVLSTW